MEVYSYGIFFLVLACFAGVCAISMETLRSFARNPPLYLFWFFSSNSFLLALLLAPLSRLPLPASIFRLASSITLVPSLLSTLMLLLFLYKKRSEGSLHRYEGAIIDSLREIIVIFDSRGRVLSFGRENPLPDCLFFDRIPSIPNDHPFSFLNGLLAQPKEASGTLSQGNFTWFWRFKPLPRDRGSLLTLLDSSREKELADSLVQTGGQLRKRQKLLLSLEALDADARLAHIRNHVSTEIDREVRSKLSSFLDHGHNVPSLEQTLALAEESLADVRQLVSELAPYREAF